MIQLMARIARMVAPGFPHHITQRGNRRQITFFCEEDYSEYIEWSSATAHINGQDDGFVKVAPILERVADWYAFLKAKTGAEEVRSLQQHERTGRPLGNKHFIDALEKILNRIVRPQKSEPKTSN